MSTPYERYLKLMEDRKNNPSGNTSFQPDANSAAKNNSFIN